MVPRARSKFGAPIFEPEVFQKQMYCTEVLVIFLGLFGTLIVIRCPGNCGPWWLLRSATQLNQSWYTVLTRGIWEPWALMGKIFQFTRTFAPPWGKWIGEFCRAMVLL